MINFNSHSRRHIDTQTNVTSLKYCVSWEECSLHCSDAIFPGDTLELAVCHRLWSLPPFPHCPQWEGGSGQVRWWGLWSTTWSESPIRVSVHWATSCDLVVSAADSEGSVPGAWPSRRASFGGAHGLERGDAAHRQVPSQGLAWCCRSPAGVKIKSEGNELLHGWFIKRLT